jgi:hypothetical protein
VSELGEIVWAAKLGAWSFYGRLLERLTQKGIQVPDAIQGEAWALMGEDVQFALRYHPETVAPPHGYEVGSLLEWLELPKPEAS